MRYIFSGFIVFSILFFNSLDAKSYYNDCNSCNGYYHSSSTYIVKTKSQLNFVDCDKHHAIMEKTVKYNSDSGKYTYLNYTIYNSDGAILQSNCTDVIHSIIEGKHYIIFEKKNYYKIMDGDGNIISKRDYYLLRELNKNRYLARIQKKYGVIDIKENQIVPIKYKKLKKVYNNLLISNLNGYYGLITYDNDIVIPNEYNSIKPLYDVFILKKSRKYGLASLNGEIILNADNDKIKNLEEYFIVKKDGFFSIYDLQGNLLDDEKYKKVKIKKNVLYGKIENNIWVEAKTKL